MFGGVVKGLEELFKIKAKLSFSNTRLVSVMGRMEL